MAFFKKLFDKKECDLCGGEIGLLGNRKLEDGNCCKECAKKLSPWFEDRRESTVAEIRAQLEYRAQNAEELKAFRPDKHFGDECHMFVEEREGRPYRFCVSREEDYLEENADLVLFSNVSEIIVDIDDNASENTADEEDEDTEPAYDLSYTFRICLIIENNPYISSMNFTLNREPVEVCNVYTRYEDCETPEDRRLYQEMYPRFVEQYCKYKTMCDQIEAMVRDPAAPAGKTCPGCGAPCDSEKFCTNCGTALC